MECNENKNVYAVSGDKIELSFKINNQLMGSEVKNQLIKYTYLQNLNEISHGILFKNDETFDLFIPKNKKVKS